MTDSACKYIAMRVNEWVGQDFEFTADVIFYLLWAIAKDDRLKDIVDAKIALIEAENRLAYLDSESLL